MGTGWLGWTAEQTFATPMQQILLAFEGRVDCAVRTSPFGSKPKPKAAPPERIAAGLLRALRRHPSYRCTPPT